MRDRQTKRRIALTVVLFAAIIYVASFFWLRYWYLPTYESNHFPDSHPIRPTYAVAYYPLRLWAAHDWSLSSREPKIRVGKVAHVERNLIEFDLEGGYLSIGFVCEASVCSQLNKVRPGDQVEARFGVALVSDQDTPINKLLALRICEAQDPGCDAGREKQRQEDVEHQRRREVSDKQRDECRAAMERTLLADPRYIVLPELEPAPTVVDDWNALAKEQKICADALIEAHRQAVFDSCNKHRCGDQIGGGCWHIAGQLPSRVVSQALQKCN